MDLLPRWLWGALVVLLAAGAAVAQPRPESEPIGSWMLTCPAAPPTASCVLRHSTWILPPGTPLPNVALEVVKRGERFVPVVAVRDISLQAALAGMLAVQVALRFDNGTPVPTRCGFDGTELVCAPEGTAAATVTEQLVTAHSITVQMQFGLPGAVPTEQSRSLDLQRTPDALARFHATAPAGETAPAIEGLDWRGFLDRVLRDAGYQHGIVDVLGSVGAVWGGRKR